MKLKIDNDSIGLRLDKFLSQELGIGLSRSQIQKKINSGEVLVNKQKVTKHYFLKNNDIIQFSSSKVSSSKDNKKLFKNVKIISKTNDYLIINKPARLLVHPVKSSNAGILPKAKLFDRANSAENFQEKTLVDWLIKKYPKIKNVYDRQNKDGKLRPGIVHRLDRDVSGLMVIAKTQKMFDYLKEQFRSRKINKEYTTLVYGQIDLNEGEINRSITRSKKTGLMIARGTSSRFGVEVGNSEQGKDAITQFEVIQRFKNYTLLKIKLITGRTHQIRVHLRSIGHSVVGDTLYQTRNLKHKKSKFNLNKIFLCATKLGFYDLESNWQEFTIDLSDDLTEFLKELRC